MAYTSDIERLNYYEGEYLGALDLAAEQEYHREMRRRHNAGQHTWGIVSGLDLAQIPNGQTTAGLAQVDVYVQPGMAVDAFGREIVVLNRKQITQDLFAAFYDPNANAAPRNIYIWIAYDQQFAELSPDTCARRNTANPYNRVQESFRLQATSSPNPVPPLNDSMMVDGVAVTPPVEPATPPSPAPTPAPGEIVFPYDGSVPYQQFALDDTTAHWYVLLGHVLWHPHLGVLLQTASIAAGRRFSGAVAAAIEAPDGKLIIQDRLTPSPLPADPTYSGVDVEIEGPLTVDRLLTARQDLWLIEHGHLVFKQSDGSDGDTPLWIRRFSNAAGGADLHIHIGDTGAANRRLTVGFGADEGNQTLVVAVRSDNNVDIPTGVVNFGAITRQMLNLWGTAYGIGIQDNTEYFRTNDDFCWFRGGTHSGGRNNPGGGALAMQLDNSSRLSVTGDVIVGGNVGIGTSTPGLRLDVRGDLGRDDAGIQLHLWGSRVGDVGNGILFLRSAGDVIAFDGNDKVGIGTNAPDYRLDVADRMRVRSGAMGSAGMFFFQSNLGADRAFVGMYDDTHVGFWGSNFGWGTVMDINNGNVGIGTVSPTKKLSVSGAVNLTGNIGTTGFDPDLGYPSGWGGGVHTWDVYAEGSISSPHKLFIIDHPLDPERKHLVHSTLEGPEHAVFYRGEARLSKGKATINLPEYFEALTRSENRTVLVTPKYSAGTPVPMLAASEVQRGRFTVHADSVDDGLEFFWEVKAVRKDVDPLEIELAKPPFSGDKKAPRHHEAARP